MYDLACTVVWYMLRVCVWLCVLCVFMWVSFACDVLCDVGCSLFLLLCVFVGVCCLLLRCVCFVCDGWCGGVWFVCCLLVV